MKLSVYLLLFTLLISIISCQKETNSILPPVNIDSLKSVLPKQVIFTDITLPPATATLIYSIKYDTLNQRIDFYSDDTTNSTPYDVLAGTYMYNNSGYLINYKIFDQGSEISSTIGRAADNKINLIAHEDQNLGLTDTSFLSYQIVGGNTEITTIVKAYYPAFPVIIDTFIHSYSPDFKLMQVLHNGSTTYEYNSNNSIKKILSVSSNGSNETNFFYTSGIADGKEDVVLKTFLGKDYYIQNLKPFYPFAIFIDAEYNVVSATDPYHLTRMQDITNDNGQITTEERSWTYELNDKKLLTRLTGSLDSQQETIVIFKY